MENTLAALAILLSSCLKKGPDQKRTKTSGVPRKTDSGHVMNSEEKPFRIWY